MTNEDFLDQILSVIQHKDPLHYKKVKSNIEELSRTYGNGFYNIVSLLRKFFDERKLSIEKIASDYLRMIDDMRVEGKHFKRTKQYSCANQHDAYVNVYSKADVMEYYMNALLLSQVLWTHHFKMLMFFSDQLKDNRLDTTRTVLDIGPGHGFFSYLVNENLTSTESIDIVDISDGSLEMTKAIIGDGGGKINYFNRDIFNYESDTKYDLIILGEVLEHLDEPLLILRKLSDLLSENGYLWLTTPTNAPALDHVYLFRSRQEIIDLLMEAEFTIVNDFGCFAEDVTEEMAIRFD
ncbi:MAG: class I SAM-dependent methyltransferase, partial [Chitinophagaceae bacterium]